MSFENIDQPKEIMDQVKKYQQQGCGLLSIMGQNSTGKTFLANEIYNDYKYTNAINGRIPKTAFISEKYLHNLLDGESTTQSMKDKLISLYDADMLVLDGIYSNTRDFRAINYLNDLIETRHGRVSLVSTIITSSSDYDCFLFVQGKKFCDKILDGNIINLSGERKLKSNRF